jgi:hypothetical protein
MINMLTSDLPTQLAMLFAARSGEDSEPRPFRDGLRVYVKS